MVNELKPGKRVAWKSPKGQGADEWEETEVTFDLSTEKTCWREEKGVPIHTIWRFTIGEGMEGLRAPVKFPAEVVLTRDARFLSTPRFQK